MWLRFVQIKPYKYRLPMQFRIVARLRLSQCENLGDRKTGDDTDHNHDLLFLRSVSHDRNVGTRGFEL